MTPRPTPVTPVVAVPARNEERRLPALIEALGAQTWEGGNRPLDVVIVLNNCTDASRDAAALAARRQPRLRLDLVEIDFPGASAHVGSARRLALERALAIGPDGAVLLTTDADAVPAPDWIEANLRAIGAGADIVGGRIVGDAGEEARLGPGFLARAELQLRYAALCDRLADLIDPLDHDPWPRHRDHTGASLAVRGAVYRAVGGLPAVPFREDLAFVSRVRAAGYRLRHCPDVRVGVSARLVGRAPGGMADCLKDWMRAEAEGRPLLVEAPEAVEARSRTRRLLRGLAGRGRGDHAALARSLGLDFARFTDGDGALLPVPRLVEALAPDEPDAPARTPVERAIAVVERMIGQREASPAAA